MTPAEIMRLAELEHLKLKILSKDHRCFRLIEEDGTESFHFFIGESMTIDGQRKYGICRMVKTPTAEDINNITEDTFKSLYLQGRIELL